MTSYWVSPTEIRNMVGSTYITLTDQVLLQYILMAQNDLTDSIGIEALTSVTKYEKARVAVISKATAYTLNFISTGSSGASDYKIYEFTIKRSTVVALNGKGMDWFNAEFERIKGELKLETAEAPFSTDFYGGAQR